jgi:hypothetical protein
MDENVIEPSSSKYASPKLLVARDDNTFRAVGNYRALNSNSEIKSVTLADVNSTFH